MLIAVPVAAAIGVLTRFGVEQYRASLLYRGAEGGLNDLPPEPAAKPRRSRKAADKADAGP